MRTDYRLKPLATALAVVIGAVAVACGGGGDGNGGDGRGESQPAREQLKLMALELDDLPAGFVQVEEAFSTNEELAGASGDAAEETAKLEAQGRLLGYERVFEPEAASATGLQFLGVQSTVSLYTTAEGASQSFAEAVQAARDTDWAGSHPGFEDLQVREIPPPHVADEALWLRIIGLTGQENPDLLIDDFVLSRRGNARTLLRVASVSGDSTQTDYLLDVIEGLLTSQMERIDAVLNAGP